LPSVLRSSVSRTSGWGFLSNQRSRHMQE
jgi:hypothetical protein